ncbi:hypothetical protein HDZ31DRAFT_60339 [Schizophyllum fasciatum]
MFRSSKRIFGVQPEAVEAGRTIDTKPKSDIDNDIRVFVELPSQPYYAIKAKDVYAGVGPKALRNGFVVAWHLVSLVIISSVFPPSAQKQLAAFFRILKAPHLNEIKILRPGRSTKLYERANYDFLQATTSLQLVTLNIECCYKEGLKEYLRSKAARRLISFRLETSGTAKIATHLFGGLASDGHDLPDLQQLTLRNIDGVTPRALLVNIQIRHMRGCTRPLLVEWEGPPIPLGIIAEGIKSDICFKQL